MTYMGTVQYQGTGIGDEEKINKILDQLDILDQAYLKEYCIKNNEKIGDVLEEMINYFEFGFKLSTITSENKAIILTNNELISLDSLIKQIENGGKTNVKNLLKLMIKALRFSEKIGSDYFNMGSYKGNTLTKTETIRKNPKRKSKLNSNRVRRLHEENYLKKQRRLKPKK